MPTTNDDTRSPGSRGALLRGGLWSGSASVVQSVCRLVSVPLALAFLSVEQYGTWVLAFVFLQYAGLSTVGFPPAYQRFTARYWKSAPEQFARHVATVFWSAVVVLGAILGAVLLAAPLLVEQATGDVGQRETLLTLVRVVAATYFIEQIFGVFSSVLLGAERFRQQSLAGIAGEVANLAVQVVLFLQGWGLLAMAWAYALAALVRSGLCALDVLRGVPGFRLGWRWFTPRLLGTVWGYGGMMQVLVAVGGVIESLPRLAAGAIAGLAGAGLVHIAQRIPNQVTAVAGACLVPLMSRAARIEATRELLIAGTRTLAGLALPAAAALVALAPQVITGWLGHADHDVLPAMRLFALAYFVNLLTGPATQVLRGQGQLRYELVKTCLGGGITLAWYLLMPRAWGLAGLGGGFLAGMSVGAAYLFVMLDHRFVQRRETAIQGSGFRVQGSARLVGLVGVLWRPAIRSVAAGVLTVLLLQAIGFAEPFSRSGAMAGLGIGSVAFVGLYGLLALATLEPWERVVLSQIVFRLRRIVRWGSRRRRGRPPHPFLSPGGGDG